MKKTIEDSLFALIGPKEDLKAINKNRKADAKYSAVVLEGNKLDEAIQKANEHDEFDFIIEALKPANRAKQ